MSLGMEYTNLALRIVGAPRAVNVNGKHIDPAVMLSPNARNLVALRVGSGASIVTVNSHEEASGGASAVVGTLGQSTVQVTVD